LQTWPYNPQNRHDGSAFALTYSLRRRSCSVMGVLLIAPLPPLVEDIRCSKAPSLCERYLASSLLQAWPPPSRRQSTSRRPRLYARPPPPISRWDEDGFSSCSACPCHRAVPNRPAEVASRLGQPAACHAAFAPDQRARPSESFFFEATPG